MCITFGRKRPTRRIAPKNGIVCYKLMLRDNECGAWKSLSYGFCYFDGAYNPYQRIRLYKDLRFWEGYDGYHSYATKKAAIACTCDYVYLVRCLIPAGASYYVGKHYEVKNYISSRIVITGNLKAGKLT